jgi:hypothetical protein
MEGKDEEGRWRTMAWILDFEGVFDEALLFV